MKMLKKIAAAIMAVAMATLMLTACGEDSAPSYRLQKIVEANQKTGKTYVEVEANGNNTAFAMSGKDSYVALPLQNGNNKMEIVAKESGTYILYPNLNGYVKAEGYSNVVGSVDAVVPSQSKLNGIAVAPQYEIKNVGMFYAEVITVESGKVAYCFDGDKVVYVVIEEPDNTTVIKVNKWTNEIPEEIQNKMALKGYTEIQSAQ